MYLKEEDIKIAYNILKIKFDILFRLWTLMDDIKDHNYRIILIDITYIYNFLFGYFINNRSFETVFSKKYIDLHVVELLNLIAHYRRYCMNYHTKYKKVHESVWIYKSPNLKQNAKIYNEIYNNLLAFKDILPNFYVKPDSLDINKFFVELFNQKFSKIDKENSSGSCFIFSKDPLLKALLYSKMTELFDNEGVLVEPYYKSSKLYCVSFEERNQEYNELFYNDNSIDRKMYRENFYKLVLLEEVSHKVKRVRKYTKLMLLKDLVNNNTSYDKIIYDNELKEFYKQLQNIFVIDDQYKTLIKNVIEINDTVLYDKDIDSLNEETNIIYNQIKFPWLLKKK